MDDKYNLDRFVEAQRYSFDAALQELRNGRKTSHWMWFIFPQLKGLGRSYNSNYYGLASIDEARAYLAHPVLNERLRKVCNAILELETSDARSVFGGIDSHKLLSSMTIFDIVSPNDIFADVIAKFYRDRKDNRTLELIQN